MFVPAVAMCLNAGGMGRQDAETETLIPTSGGVFDVPIAWSEELTATVNVAGTIQRGGAGGRHDGVLAPIAFDTTQITSKENGSNPKSGDPCHSSRSYIAQPWAVRRLSPRECERLQGFPDDWTLIERPHRRTLKSIEDELAYLRQEYPSITEDEAIMLAADGPRYKALGNSMAVPVIRWIMDRIRISAKQAAA